MRSTRKNVTMISGELCFDFNDILNPINDDIKFSIINLINVIAVRTSLIAFEIGLGGRVIDNDPYDDPNSFHFRSPLTNLFDHKPIRRKVN